MTKCEECGLPIAVCNALASYRKAIENFERGKIGAARDMAEFAEEEYKRYRAYGEEPSQ